MSNRIKGITIELNGDSTKLQDALKDVNKRSNDLARELKDVDKLLRFNPGNLELLSQKQQLLTDRIAATTEKLDALKSAQAQVEAQFQSGEIGVEQYNRFRRELITTEGSLNGLRNQLQRLTDEQNAVQQSTRQLETLFQATGTSVDQFADALGTQLTNAIRNGTATSQQLEQAIDQIGQAALGADVDLNRMRDALRNVDNGASLDQVRQDLNQIEQEANQAEDAVNSFGNELSTVVGGLVAGGGIAGVVSQALDASSLKTKIDITFEVPEESKESVRAAIKGVQAYGIDAEEALEGVRRQWALNKDASDETNAAVVNGASLIASVYSGIDFVELIQEANEIGAALNISNEEAMGMVNTLLKMNFPPEQLDIIAEYGEQLSIAGYTAEEIQNIFAAGVETKTWNIDNLLDGLKEGKIGLSEFGLEIPKALDELLQKTSISSEQMKTWGAAVAKGGEEGSQAMIDVITALAGVEDAAVRNELGVQLLGTKWEDQGMKIVDTLLNAQNGTANLSEGVAVLNEDINRMDEDPMVRLKDAASEMIEKLEPLLTGIAEFVGKVAEWAAENPVLIASLAAIGTVIGIIVGALAALMPAILSVVTLFGTAAGGAGILSGATAALGTAFAAITGPIGIAVAAVVGLIAIFTALYKNNEEFRDKVQEIWQSIQNAVSTALDFIGSIVKTVMSAVSSFFGEQLTKIKAFWDENGKAIMDLVKTYFGLIQSNIEMVMGIIKGIFEVVWPIISGIVKIAWENIKLVIGTALDIVLGIIQTVMKILQGDWAGAWETIKDTSEKIMNNIIDFFKGIDLVQIGKDIIAGLINGIGSMIGAVAKKVTEVANTIKDTVTGIFQINSPSKLFEGYGINLNEGFINGIQKSSTQLQSAMDNVYGSLATNANRMMQSNVSNVSTNTYDNSKNFNPVIHVNAGSSASDIARANERVLRRLAFQYN